MNGFLLINKPTGITTYDIIRKIKSLIPKCKIGHSGTLDPFATGLVITLGRNYTKQLHDLQKLNKTYEATVTLGIQTDSYDCDGTVTNTHNKPISFSDDTINASISQFIGPIKQQPPIYSAKKSMRSLPINCTKRTTR